MGMCVLGKMQLKGTMRGPCGIKPQREERNSALGSSTPGWTEVLFLESASSPTSHLPAGWKLDLPRELCRRAPPGSDPATKSWGGRWLN